MSKLFGKQGDEGGGKKRGFWPFSRAPKEEAVEAPPEKAVQQPAVSAPSWGSLRELAKQLQIPVNSFLEDAHTPAEARAFLDRLDLEAESLMHPEEEEPPARDAFCRTLVAEDGMTAWAFLFPPMGGKELTAEELLQAVKADGIVSGLLEERIRAVAEEKDYFLIFTAARGLAPVDGEDGKVIDRYPREKSLTPAEVDDYAKSVDFRNLGWLQTVEKDGIICEIVYPTEYTDGYDVRGNILAAHRGAEPEIPMGNNTRLTEDGKALAAECDGQLSFVNGKFQLDQVLHIKGDVDNSVGNLDMTGDIVIHGNVTEGFTVKATGNITVMGVVEGAFITSGGNIKITLGMKGSFKGVLEAGGEVRCSFMENCTVKAGGSVFTSSIINSKVESGDSVIVSMGKAIIIGGSISALNNIEAKVIGNDSNRPITLQVGIAPDYWANLRALEKKRAEIDTALDGMEKDIAYLEGAGTLNESYQQLLKELKMKQSVQKMALLKTDKQLGKMRAEEDHPESQIVAAVIYPPADIAIGNLRMTLSRAAHACRIHRQDGEISLGIK